MRWSLSPGRLVQDFTWLNLQASGFLLQCCLHDSMPLSLLLCSVTGSQEQYWYCSVTGQLASKWCCLHTSQCIKNFRSWETLAKNKHLGGLILLQSTFKNLPYLILMTGRTRFGSSLVWLIILFPPLNLKSIKKLTDYRKESKYQLSHIRIELLIYLNWM